MKAVVLAGGYAKRLKPVIKDFPKPLLPIKGKPIVDYIVEKLFELEEVDEITVLTNRRFVGHFEEWVKKRKYEGVSIVAEPSRHEEEKLGSLKAIAWLLSGRKLEEDCLIIGGDNLFTSSLRPVIEYYREIKSPLLGVYDLESKRLAKEYSVVKLDSTSRVIGFIEKPEKPDSTLIGTCIYIMPKRTVKMLHEYLREGKNPDSPGHFIQWLHKRTNVYGYRLKGQWYDIGTPKIYQKVKENFQPD